MSPQGPRRPTTSNRMKAKEYTSPFWDPLGGLWGLLSSSGARTNNLFSSLSSASGSSCPADTNRTSYFIVVITMVMEMLTYRSSSAISIAYTSNNLLLKVLLSIFYKRETRNLPRILLLVVNILKHL